MGCLALPKETPPENVRPYKLQAGFVVEVCTLGGGIHFLKLIRALILLQ